MVTVPVGVSTGKVPGSPKGVQPVTIQQWANEASERL